jgi:EAL domain-containing protein (putative c-di-GMP-specific phosphodiesterase class I)
VDRSFVSAIGTKSADTIIEAIVTMARGLEMVVTAEGVETERQRQFLQRVGCHEIQGYLTSAPLPEGRLAGMLAKAEVDRH